MLIGVLWQFRHSVLRSASLLAISFACASSSLAGGGPRDVLIVVNSNSPASREICRYYQAARGIPDSNVCTIYCPDQEVVTGEVCETRIREPIRQFLRKPGIAGKIDYIVLTKGIPLSADYGRPSSGGPYSVSSILTAVDHPDIQDLFEFPYGPNAYYRWGAIAPDAAWSHSISFRDKNNGQYYSFYLVTRLDAYTVDQVKTMIDRSLQPAVDGLFALDKTGYAAYNVGNFRYANNRLGTTLTSAYDALVKRGCDVRFDGGQDFLCNLRGVIGYFSWANHDDKYTFAKYVSNTFVPGSIADTYWSYSGMTFDSSAFSYGPLIADLIPCGLCGAGAYVSEPQITTATYANLLFDRYTRGYNLAESFFAGCPDGFWKTVVIGDPLLAPYATPPQVSLAPTPTVMHGVETVTATATDASGVSRVEFYLDDDLVGVATASPFCVTVDTNEYAIGPHRLEAIAYESSAQATQGLAVLQVDVDNPVSTVGSIDDARIYEDGQFVRIRDKIVTAGTDEIGDGFFLEEPNRSSAIKVVTAHSASRGEIVSITGAMETVDGYRVVTSASVDSRTPGGLEPRPLCMRMCDLGGSAVGDFTPGVGSGVGPYNVALLVKVVGKVTDRTTGEFHVTDRSVASPVTVLCPDIESPPVGSWVAVTGLCVAEAAGGGFRPAIRARSSADISIL